MGFRPQDFKPQEQDKSEGEGWVPAGKYVIAVVGLKVTTVKNGTSKRARFKCRVMWAPPEARAYVGNVTWLGCGLNTGSEGQAKLLGAICNGMGQVDEFDVQSTRELRQALMYKPLAVQLKKKQDGDYTNNEWGKIFGREECNPELLQLMDTWYDDLLQELGEPNRDLPESGNGGGGNDDPGPTDEDAPGARGWF